MIRLTRTWTASAAAAVLLSSLALGVQAQSAAPETSAAKPHAHAHAPAGKHHHGARPAVDAAQHQAQRAQRLQTLLQIQPQQQAALDAYIQATAPVARGERTAHTHPQAQSTPERIAAQQQLRKQRLQHIEQREQATLRFYKALNASQQKVFDVLRPEGRGHGPAHAKQRDGKPHGEHRHGQHPQRAPQAAPAA